MNRFSLIAFILIISFNICRCEILNVPSEYPAIQAAIDSAENGDTVLVAEGTYFENIIFKGKGIVVASNYIFTNDWQTVLNTTIDGSTAVNKDSASVVRLLNNEDSTAVLEGFTITGGTGTNYEFSSGNWWHEGAGIILSHSSAVIRNNLIINNGIVPTPGIKDGGGGGIASMYGNPTICNNVIASNNAGYAGGIVLNWSGGKIRNNIIYHNTGRASYGTGGVMLWVCPPNTAFLENNTIISNISFKDAGGININTTSNVVKNNIVWGNRQVTGGQVVNAYLGSFNNIEDYSREGNISLNPLLLENSFSLKDGSPCIDAGDPGQCYYDLEDELNPGNALVPSKGNLTNDIGAFGGCLAKLLPELDVTDLYISKNNITNMRCEVQNEKSAYVEILNLSSIKLQVDSVINSDTTEFKINYPGKLLNLFESDTIKITFKPLSAGTKNDTVKIYHQAEGSANPIKIILKGIADDPVGVEKNPDKIINYALQQNYPNPFNPSTNIEFSLPVKSYVSLKVYDILGNEIAELINNQMNAGIHQVIWKPDTKISSGIYFINLLTPDFNAVRKIVYQK